MKFKLNSTKKIAGILIIIGFLFFAIIYGSIGARIFIGVLLLYFLPFYLIFDKFDLSLGEKVVFSIFIGFGTVPIIIYYVSRIFGLRASILITFIVLVIGSIIFRFLYVRNIPSVCD